MPLPQLLRRSHYDVAIVPHRLMKVKYDVEFVLSAPSDELVDLAECRFAERSGSVLENDLVETQPHMVETPPLDTGYVRFCYVSLEVLQVARGYGKAPV